MKAAEKRLFPIIFNRLQRLILLRKEQGSGLFCTLLATLERLLADGWRLASLKEMSYRRPNRPECFPLDQRSNSGDSCRLLTMAALLS